MERIAVAVSGGIDSLVAACLLKDMGHELIGIHFTTGYEIVSHDDLYKMAEQIGMSLKIIDCKQAFESLVVDYFIKTYQSGKTPNPCLVCNPQIKFGVLLDHAMSLGADGLATGHYAKIREGKDGHFHLIQAKDTQKDQSYFLGFLSQAQLSQAVFPLGSMTKTEVRNLAAQKNIMPVSTKESQDICFIREKNYREFFKKRNILQNMPGPIEDVEGQVIGKHPGLSFFTVGQRRGINCPASEPYYVVCIDQEKNRLVVGFKKDLYSAECKVENINWIMPVPDKPLELMTRIRYRHKPAESTLIPVDTGNDSKNRAIVRFHSPQAAVTPGQGAVFYMDNEVMGAGWIR